VLTQISQYDKQVWDLMRVIRFEANAREELLKYLGFDSTSIAAAAQALATANAPPATSEQPPSVTFTPPVSVMENMSIISAEETADFFGSSPPAVVVQEEIKPVKVSADFTPVPPPSDLSPSVKAISAEMLLTAISGEKLEPSIRSALVVGNFSAAVEYCIEAGLMAEALLLAQCGEAGLWIRTQEMFFKKLGQRYPFLNILHAVVNSNLIDLVIKSDLTIWKETLAILSTYGKSDEFPALCEVICTYQSVQSI
jgi:protein transport protein SEC31